MTAAKKPPERDPEGHAGDPAEVVVVEVSTYVKDLGAGTAEDEQAEDLEVVAGEAEQEDREDERAGKGQPGEEGVQAEADRMSGG